MPRLGAFAALRDTHLTAAERIVVVFTLCAVVALATWQISTSSQVGKLRVVACGQRLDGLDNQQIDRLRRLCGPPARKTTIVSTPATPGEQVVGGRGENGKNGQRGKSGHNGRNGRAGSSGRNGSTGGRGPRGERGRQGAQGPQGPKGDRGERGRQGVAGSDGVSPSTQALVQQAVEQVLARVCARVPQVCQ